jgi:hypothetical protein
MILDIDRVFSAEELVVVRGQETVRQPADKQQLVETAA